MDRYPLPAAKGKSFAVTRESQNAHRRERSLESTFIFLGPGFLDELGKR
jgi:hypothetical protein